MMPGCHYVTGGTVGGLPGRGQLVVVWAVVMASRSVVLGRPIRRDEFHGRVVRTASSRLAISASATPARRLWSVGLWMVWRSVTLA
jgi:hypothetical protein